MGRTPNLSQSTIYHIRCKITKRVIYVGSSCDFINREKKHRYNCCNNESSDKYNLPIYKYIRENGGFENYEIIPVSFHNLNNIVELRILEQQEMDKHTGLMNCVYASRTREQYRIDNKEKINEREKQYNNDNKELRKKYREDNREKINEHKKQYDIDNREKTKQYYQNNKEHIKQYRIDNREKINETKKLYREKNKEKIKEKITCECGCIVVRCNLTRHKKSKKHLDLIAPKIA